MTARLKPDHGDWLFGGSMFLLCFALTILQYRWTGQIADAEMARLRGNLDEQTRAIASEFDAELCASCNKLASDRDDLPDQSLEKTILSNYKTWKASNPRPMFKKIAFAAGEMNGLHLAVLNEVLTRFAPAEWPTEWRTLEKNLTEKFDGGSPPFQDPRGLLMEFPVTDGPTGGWLILELDTNYLHTVWLRELVSDHIEVAGQTINEALVRTTGEPPLILYAIQTNTVVPSSAISVGFNFLGKTRSNSRGPPPKARWILETWQRAGALEATVAASRHRNLAIAMAINFLLLASGIALMRHTRKARQLAELQMHFVANVSHEFRTPITVIRGAAHNLKRGLIVDPDRTEQYSGLIIEHCEQLTAMVEQVLELAGAHRLRSPTMHPVPVAAVLNEAVVCTQSETQAAHCKVETNFSRELPEVAGDASALRRVFQNLIANAAKHGGQGGWIGITAALHHDSHPPFIEIQVADCGPGIAADEQNQLFKPFFRGARTLKNQIRGAGLGLSVVKEIVEAHGGNVEARNRNDGGAIFVVRLPVDSQKKQ